MIAGLDRAVLPFVADEHQVAVFGQLAWAEPGPDPVVETRCFGRRLTGEVVVDSDLFPNYCAGRVPLLLEVTRFVAERRCGWGDRIGGYLPWLDSSWVGELSLADVALHRRGLHAINGVLARLVDRPTLRTMIAELAPDDGPADQPVYSDYAVGHLLGEVVEALGGDDYASCVDAGSTAFPGEHGSHRRDLSVVAHADLRLGRPVAALGDAVASATGRWNPSFGWYGSARALAARLAGGLASIEAATDLEPLLRTRGHNPWDETLQRPLSVAFLGCSEWFGTPVVGLSGQGGISFCGYDPELRRVLAWNVSPALDTQAALARSRSLLDVLRAPDPSALAEG